MSVAQLGREEESAQVARALCRDHPEFDPAAICDVCYLLDPRARSAVQEGLRRIERYLIPD
jgi:hypothetical protein